ncbi:MAG: macrolide ABC transporter ATP-binding protein, partial [Candidatus Aminicenantes bacterium]|nr:macrolide ABC transporter ATP-binding protein [Candidatus Aminicenantes bacterium]
MATFQELNRQGITIIMVTHEHDIAAYCRRIIEFRDGRIIRDLAVAHPHDAGKDLESGRWQTAPSQGVPS